MAVLRESLASIREDAGMKLLPVLTKIVDVVGASVVPAFAKLVDKMLPDVISGLNAFADAMAAGGAEKAISGITSAIGTMIDMLKLAAGPVKMIVGAFMALPKELQTILVAGFAVNKLSGGMLVQLGGELFKRGGTPANPLFVKDVGLPGGLGGGKGGPGIPAVGGGSLLATLGAAGITAAAVAAAAWTIFKVTEAAFNPPGGGHDPTIAENKNPANVQAAVWSSIAHNLDLVTHEPAKGSGRGDTATAKEVKRLGDIQALAARITAAGGKASAERIEAIMAKNVRATESGDTRVAGRIDSMTAAVRAIKIAPVINVSTYPQITIRNVATANRIASAVDVRKGTGGGKIYEP